MYHNITYKNIIVSYMEALKMLESNIDANSIDIVIDNIMNCKGKLILTGIGKSGYIAHKIAASFSSTGTVAIYIHPSEANHGDLGMITKDDIIIILSKSGLSEELIPTVKYCKKNDIKIISITMNLKSYIAQNSNHILKIPDIQEISQIGSPTTSILFMLVIGDILTITTQEKKAFSKQNFYNVHPSGGIGLNALQVCDIMCKSNRIKIMNISTPLLEAMMLMITTQALYIIAINDKKEVLGIITQESFKKISITEISLQITIEQIVYKNILFIHQYQNLEDTLLIMNDKSISVSIIYDKTIQEPIGILDSNNINNIL